MNNRQQWRLSWIFVMAVLVGTGGSQGRAAEVNRVSNSGFEETKTEEIGTNAYLRSLAAAGWTFGEGATARVLLPETGWTYHSGPAGVRIISGQEGKEVYRGKRCLRLQTSDKDAGFYQERTGFTGIQYAYRFAVRGKGRFYLRTLEYGEKGSGCVAAPFVVDEEAHPEWTEYTGVFQATHPSTKELNINIGAWPQSDIYFDEVCVWEDKYIGGQSRFDYGMGDQSYDRLAANPVISRHVPWANPLAGGKVRVLAICPQILVRGVIELAERLEMDYTVIPTACSDSFYETEGQCMPVPGYSLLVEKLARERLAADRQYDLIIVTELAWQTLPDFARQNILERVKQGAGLLYKECSPSPGHEKSKLQGNAKGFLVDVMKGTTPQVGVAERFYQQLSTVRLPLVPVADADDALRKCEEHGGPVRTDWGWRGGFWQHTPKELMPVTIQCAALGNGRVTFLDYYQGWNDLSYGRQCWLTPHNLVCNPVHYEYHYAWLVKLCLWTVTREGRETDVIDLKLPNTFERDQIPPAGMPLTFRTTSPDMRLCEYVIRDQQGDAVCSATPKLEGEGATKSIAVTVPVLPSGAYTLDLWLLTAEKAKGAFTSARFEVTASNGIETVKTDRDRYRDGDTVNGTFGLRTPLRPGERMEFSLQDSWERILAKTVVTAVDGKTGAFALPLRAPLSYCVRAVGDLVDARGRVDRKSVLIGIPRTDNNDFYLSCPALEYGQESYDHTLAEQLLPRFPAFNAGKPWGGTATSQQFAQWNLPNLVFVNSGLGWGGGHANWKDGLKDGRYGPVFNNCPTVKAKDLEGLCKVIGATDARFGVIGHTVNSETFLIPEFCFCENCLGRFRTWLKTIYKDDIGGLNREWAADYKDFSQVLPARLSELPACETKGTAARWLDSRLFMYDQTWTQAFRNEAAWLQPYYGKVNASVLNCKFVQVENFTPFIWENLFKDVKGYEIEVMNYSPAESLMFEMAAGFGEDRHYSGTWIDPWWYWETEHPKMSLAPWWLLFHGARGIVMWGGAGIPDVAGGCRAITPDLSDTMEYFKILHGQIAELQTGIATLITSSQKVRSPIAMVMSSRNSFAGRLTPQPDCSFQDAYESWFIALQTMGLPPQFVGQDDLTLDLIKAKGWKVLALPYNRALSADTAQVLLDFVKGGGLLLADNQPGQFTEHGRKLETGSLAALYPRFAPELCQTAYGKGTAVYLGGQLNQAQRMILDGNFSRLYALLELLKTSQGIEPGVRILDASGVDRFDVFRTMFRYGSAQYLCVLKDPVIKGPSANGSSTILLPGNQHVYDMRRKQYLGFRDKISMDIQPHEARVFALLPAKPQSLMLSLDRKCAKPGEILPFTVNIGYTAGQGTDIGSCVLVQVRRSGNELVKYYTRKVAFRGSSKKLNLPVSLNEAPGGYIVTVKNVATGDRTNAKFLIKP